MTAAWEVIGSQTLSSATASVTFSSIPQGYRDLVLVVQHKGNTASVSATVLFNSDSGANYPMVFAGGDGSSATFSSATGSYIYTTSASTTSPALTITQIMDYSATDKHKPVLVRRNRGDDKVGMFAQRWANTSAITAIEVYTSSDNFAANSTFTLYGSNRA